ncbi:MAG: hypothetical protein EB060_04565 [Proteobacteria bacterium]|nr:hypothetical protein [Pseudomonadota bacterium]
MPHQSNKKPQLVEREARHQCLIYHGAPSQQLPALGAVLKRKLSEGYRCMYINSIPMVNGMRSYLWTIGVDVESDTAKGHLVFSSESLLTEGTTLDVKVMLKTLENALDKALQDGYKGLWATGDMTFEFGYKENLAKLLEYEYGLEELMAKRMELCGICQYHQDTLPKEATPQALLTHPVIFINETLSRVNSNYVPFGAKNNKSNPDTWESS